MVRKNCDLKRVRKLNFRSILSRFVIAASNPDISPESVPTVEMTLEVSGNLFGHSLFPAEKAKKMILNLKP